MLACGCQLPPAFAKAASDREIARLRRRGKMPSRGSNQIYVADVAKEAAKVFKKQGLDIQLGVTIGEVKVSKRGVSVAYADKAGVAQQLDADRLIVSVGRVPNTDGLNAEAVGLKLDERGRIDVDDHCRTNLPGVFAAGDVADPI